MKTRKLLIFMLWICSFPLMAQTYIFVSGTVTDINSGTPIHNHAVIIQTDSISGNYYYNVVYTNMNGYYLDSVPLMPAQDYGIINVSTYDCQQYLHAFSLTFAPGITALTQNFLICNGNSCHADYNYYPAGPLGIQFEDLSVGASNDRLWSFGDGTSSTQMNPMHLYPAPGPYTVTLTMGFQGSNCWDQETKTVYVTDSTASGCQSYFIIEPATFNPYEFHFINQSQGNPNQFHWDFGDGTSQTIMFPNNPNVTHVYSYPGTYNACLTITGNSSTCNDTYCTSITIDSTGSGCQANFTYLVPSANSHTVYFTDLSVTSGPVTWFWNFGDGTVSYEQNPVHTFPANPSMVTYNVCLTISGVNSGCFDNTCHPVTVGAGGGCEADFEANHVPNNLFEWHFQDLSAGNIQAWIWDFGDGLTQVITAPQNPNVSHIYQTSGQFTVCLHIEGPDSCNSIKCETIQVGDTLQGCHANFAFELIPGTPANTVAFTDMSMSGTPISWLWNFDDGTTSTEQNPVHVFPPNSSLVEYHVCLTITGVGGTFCTDTECKLVLLGNNQGCEADFEAFNMPNVMNTVHFEDKSEGDIQTWTWSFGDGTSQTISAPANPNVIHNYAAPGFYTVCLYISGADSCFSQKCETVMVGDSISGCQAQFSYYPDSTNNGIAMHFIDLSTGNPNQWFWNFGDGTTSNQQNPVHIFTAPGTYYVCLTIGGQSCQSTWCAEVEVGPSPNCVNYFTYNNVGLSVNFTGNILNNIGGDYFWDFGDNQTGTGENIIHTYNAAGIYYVTLTTTTGPNGGCTYTSGQMITVGDSTTWHQVYGQVFAGNFPVAGGMVMLFSLDTNNFYVPFVDIAMIDSAGVYYFPMVPEGNFLIHAIPFEYGYLPTYYGDVLFWQDATVVTLGTANNPYDIHLVQAGSCGSGGGSISGQITQGDISSALIDKVTMLLKDQDGNIIKSCQVNEVGNFEFPQLSYGTYYLYAEMAGCESQTIQVVISESNSTASISLLLSGHSILGTDDKKLNLDAGVVYPNPAKDNARVAIRLSSASDLTINLFNLEGQIVYSQQQSLPSGETNLVIPVSQLATGIYYLKIETRQGQLLTRKLVKTN